MSKLFNHCGTPVSGRQRDQTHRRGTLTPALSQREGGRCHAAAVMSLREYIVRGRMHSKYSVGWPTSIAGSQKMRRRRGLACREVQGERMAEAPCTGGGMAGMTRGQCLPSIRGESERRAHRKWWMMEAAASGCAFSPGAVVFAKRGNLSHV